MWDSILDIARLVGSRDRLTAPEKINYFCLPFTGIHSLQIRTQINRLRNAAFPHLDIRFVLQDKSLPFSLQV